MPAIFGFIILCIFFLFGRSIREDNKWKDSSRIRPPVGVWILGNDSPNHQVHHGFTKIYMYGSDGKWRCKPYGELLSKVCPPRFWTHLPSLETTYLRSK